MFVLLTLGMYLFAGVDEYNSIIIRGFQSGNSFVSNVSRWNTQLFLFKENCDVNSLVHLLCSGAG